MRGSLGRIALAAVLLACTAGSASAAEADWPQLGQTPAHHGFNSTETAFTLGNVPDMFVDWSGTYGQSSADESSPVVKDGVVYIAGFDGNVSAYAAAGCGGPSCSPLWQGHTKNDITATPAVVGGTLYVASADHWLYAFAADGCGAATCAPSWRGRMADADVTSSVLVAHDVAYVGAYDGHLYAFAAAGCGRAKCDPLWTGTAGGHIVASPGIAGDSVFVGSDDTHLYVFPAAGCGTATCDPSWTAQLGGPAYQAAPTAAGGHVYVVSSQNFGAHNGEHLQVFPADGCGAAVCTPEWEGALGSGGTEWTPAVWHKQLIVAVQHTPKPGLTVGVIQVFPLNGCGAALCRATWTGVNFASGFESAPAVAGGVVFVAKGPASGVPVDVGVYAFDARGCGSRVCTAEAFLQVTDDGNYLSSSIAIADGHLYFGANDNHTNQGTLYAITVPD